MLRENWGISEEEEDFMKRSEINQIIKEMEALAAKNGFHLPPFCHWTPEEWKDKGMSMMRSATTCLDGISRTSDGVTLTHAGLG